MLKKLLCMWCLFAGISVSGHLSAQTDTGFREGVVRVKLQPEVGARIGKAIIPMDASGVVTTGVTQLDRVNRQVKAVRMKRVFPYSPKFEAKHKQYGLDLWYEISFGKEGMTPAEARNLYKAVPGIQIAENIRPMKLIGGERFLEISPRAVAKAAKAAATMPFNDPLLPQQWHYNNDGSIVGTVAGSDANVFKGWTVETGKKDVLVAIIDGGFQTDHPDLTSSLWYNEAELNGKPGVDDDQNGYTDDVNGYNFVINSADIGAHSHGTHVAGTVGAVNNNGIGVAGVAGGSGNGDGVRMMSCAVFDSRASNLEGDYANALIYAADMGASIAQCSWGWAEPNYYEQAVLEAIKYFTKEGGGDKMSGGLCIFANGNTGDEGDYYPACMPEVVAVGSMTATKEPASYSTKGKWCDVSAPGGLMDFGERYGVLSTLPNGTYGFNEGTSMACPHVSGIGALILSKYGNKNFTNETLRTQLTTSVNDLYTDNPDATGLYGSGYIDAYKALQIGMGTAPETVTDFTLTPSQDNVLIEWIIPQSEEKTVDHHIIYYSKEPFSPESDLAKINSVNVDTKFKNSGDPMQYELGGLTPLTKYYIAIKAYNRWGDGSELSTIKETSTNAGPEAGLDKTNLKLDIDATSSPTAEGEFNISNKGLGMLKYSLSAATKKVNISTTAVSNPTPGRIIPFSGNTSVEKASKSTVVEADYNAGDWPIHMSWTDGIYCYLGETDTKKPNALAQYFYVDPEIYPDGFNLTALNFGGYGGENPEIEIYDGARNISTASLLKKVDYMFFAYNYDINLDEQIYFQQGSSFWIVAKFADGQKNPLGAGVSTKENSKQYSFYSSDNGQTWTQLSEILKGGNYEDMAEKLSWDIKAISKNPDWSKVLNPEPAEGTVRPGENQTVKLKNNGQQLVNGTYTFKLNVNTNETENKNKNLTVTMNVKGYKPELSSKQLIDFGDLLVGNSKTISVELVNTGYGAFAGKYGALYPSEGAVACSSDQFEMPYQVDAIAARSESTMDVTFKPTKAGNISGTVTLTDKNGIKHSFTVRGVASEPAKVNVNKDLIDFGSLEVGGESKSEKITVTNDGEYPLEYAFPKFSSKVIEGVSGTHKFGYTYVSNLDNSDAFAYDGNPEINGETEITSQFNDNNWQSEPISIGFKFPFYGTDYEQIHVSSHGGLMVQTTDGRISCMVPTATCVEGLGYISAFANSGHLNMGSNSKVTYGHLNGKFIVKFKNVLTSAVNGGDDRVPVSFHIALCPDGSAELYYDDYDPKLMYSNGANIFAGISDINCKDVFVITDNDEVFDKQSTLYTQFKTGTAIKIVAPAKSMIQSLSSTDGVIGIGESKDITVTVAAGDNHYAGNLENVLTMLTNDPAKPSLNIMLKADITGDLKPETFVDSAKIEFGEVFRTSVQKRNLLMMNNGKNTLNVTSVTLKNDKFELGDDVKQAFTVAPGMGKDITLTLPTETEGAVSDELTIEHDAGEPIVIPVNGKVIGTPEWKITPETVDITTPYGVNVEKTISVENEGNEILEFGVVPADWFSVDDLTADNKNTSVDYIFKSKSDGKDVAYDWVDITTDYDSHQPLSYYLDHTDFYTLELPFEFPFYGKKYKTAYIYNTGFISFDKPETDYKQFPEPPVSIPTTDTFYKNIIAPFWGNHTMGSPSTDGTYIKSFGDHVVVSYINYGNSAMAGFNYQLILNNDGTFKFQYQLQPEGIMLGVYGLCGIQDATGTRGVNPDDQYISSGNAMMFYPVKTVKVAPEGNTQIPITVMADRLANTYNEEIEFKTNVPGKENFKLPVALNITGEADPVFPETVVMEQTIDPNYIPGEYEFTIANKGNRAFNITDISSEIFDLNTDTWVSEASLLIYAENKGGFEPGPLSADADNMQWTDYKTALPITVGKEPVKFKFMLMNTSQVHAKDYEVKFTTEGLATNETVVTAKVNVTDMPQMTFDKPEITVNAATADEIKHETMTIRNSGQYKLTYSLRLDPTGKDEAEEIPGGIASGLPNVMASKATADTRAEIMGNNARLLKKTPQIKMPADDEPYPYDYPQDEAFTNLIYYPMMKPWNSAKSAIMGSGSALAENFYAATRFTAPKEGFNLSKLYFTGTVGNLENVDIEATVIQGGDITSDRMITKGKLRVVKETPAADGNYYGEPRMLTFDKTVYINPEDTFYVVMKYPAGYGHSALLASRDGQKSANRCMAYLSSMGGWFDLEEMLDAEYGYGPMGYFMTCVETEEGKPWIKLLDTESMGEIAVGGSKTVKMEIDATRAYYDKNNKATLVIKSNDPTQKLVNYHITLNKNAAPEVTAPEGTITVKETQNAVMPIAIEDEEGDAFNVSISDADGIATISSFANGEGSNDGVSEKDGVISVEAGRSLKLNVNLAPDYGMAGTHLLTVTATDAMGNETTQDVAFNVEHTNRAPEYKGETEITLNEGQASAVFDYTTMFTDPDGDEMTYSARTSDTNVVDVFNSSTGFILAAVRTGNATVCLTATDSNGATTKTEVSVSVTPATSIGGVTADTGNMNIGTGNGGVTITVNTNVEKAVFYLYDTNGNLVARQTAANLQAGAAVKINVPIPTGVYSLAATLDGKPTVVKFVTK